MWRKRNRYCVGLVLLNLVVFIVAGYHALISLESAGADNNHFVEKKCNATLVFRDFEIFRNDLLSSVQSLRTKLPLVPIAVIGDRVLYPPVPLTKFNVSYFSLEKTLDKNNHASSPLSMIQTSHVVFLPDSFHIKHLEPFNKLLNGLSEVQDKIIAYPVGFSENQCYSLKVDVKRWAITMRSTAFRRCEAISGAHVIVVKKTLLEKLIAPFAHPFPHAFYIQTAAFGYQVILDPQVRFELAKNFAENPHYEWKREQRILSQTRNFYSDFGIKKVTRNDQVELYGCTKQTTRCFGTITNDMPDYLYSGRWTPPCCLENLKTTAHHVLDVLEKAQVRYWLEGGSLLGAARNGEIIPWDYDVDLGVYEEDLTKCQSLRAAMASGSFEDDGKFVWEKAKEGNFYRVQFSVSNHLHVDIFPFRSVNGIMTKDTWFLNHRQDMEFPERFLQPLSNTTFLGRKVSSPNNIREFLDLKFGNGVIENQKYPHSLDV